jgi:lipopolysaccharide transport system ATP-binding protein
MSRPIIEVSHLSKQYRLGTIGATTVRDEWAKLWSNIRGSGAKARPAGEPARIEAGTKTFWALRDISFSVLPGEVVGLVGCNGAGKSTLLKILSRITEPSSGRAVLRGRVTSLLEVGTGFHPDLPGRENIYLNGAMLGMRRAEITRKFDEIVEFAEIRDFIDTPVKRYSSGMYVRLAFAVAAHLEPEILLVDEVLAVGDAAFQKKCLGKMGDVARQGRTVLLVSHNMASILALCERAVLLDGGKLLDDGSAGEIVRKYLHSMASREIVDLRECQDRQGDGEARLTSFRIESEDSGDLIRSTSRIRLTLGYKSARPLKYPRFIAAIHDFRNTGIFVFDSDAVGGIPEQMPREGFVTCVTDPINLTPGRCYVNLSIQRGNVLSDHIEHASTFDIEADDVYGTGKVPPREEAICLLRQKWSVVESEESPPEQQVPAKSSVAAGVR